MIQKHNQLYLCGLSENRTRISAAEKNKDIFKIILHQRIYTL